MAKAIDVKRIAALFGLVMAALVVLSALNASDAEAKKKKHHHRPPAPSINTVQCPTESNGQFCFGTDSRDYLLGRDDEFDFIFGGEGDDVYDGKGGSDAWVDNSTTSNDRYLLPPTEFSQLFDPPNNRLNIQDDGGSFDVLDLSSYRFNDFAYAKADLTGERGIPDGIPDSLVMVGSGKREIAIDNFFTANSIDFFKFSNGTFTAEQIKSKV